MAVQRRAWSKEDGSTSSSVEDGRSISSDDSESDSKIRVPVEKPFYGVCGVLTVLLVIGSIMLLLLSSPSSKPLNFREAQILDSAVQRKPDHVDVVMEEEEGLDKLPAMELNPEISKHDAFGVAQQYLKNYTSSFMKQAQQLQAEYAELYGGIRPSRHLLENTLQEFGGDAWIRLLERKRNDVLHIVVLGQATAAGYGNVHTQAFSFHLEEIVKKVMSLFKIDLRVTNVALEHVATFPYLWCIPEFVETTRHEDASTIDVVYVDLGPSMTAPDLELVVRQVLGLGTPAPLLILRDSKQDTDRIELLQYYIDGGVLQSPILMEWKDAVEPFLQVKPSLRPPGFSEWTQPGAADSPHKGLSYWTAAQHKMVAWVLAMFFLKQLELLVATEEGFSPLEAAPQGELHSPILAKASVLKEPWSNYLYYSSLSRQCLTSFHPADNLHPSSGLSNELVHLEHPKGMVFYTSGWVLDLENSERKEKLRSQHHGFKDMLTSYHGIPASGTLTFVLELGATSDLVVCESQAQVQHGCKLDEDVVFTINDKPVKSVQRIATDAVSYQEKQHCVVVELNRRTSGKVRLGLQVSNNQVTLPNGPCSISHIIWQDDE